MHLLLSLIRRRVEACQAHPLRGSTAARDSRLTGPCWDFSDRLLRRSGEFLKRLGRITALTWSGRAHDESIWIKSGSRSRSASSTGRDSFPIRPFWLSGHTPAVSVSTGLSSLDICRADRNTLAWVKRASETNAQPLIKVFETVPVPPHFSTHPPVENHGTAREHRPSNELSFVELETTLITGDCLPLGPTL